MIKTILKYLMVSGLLLIWVTVSSAAARAEQKDIKIISINDGEVTLEFTLPPFEMEATPGPDGRYQKILLDGWAKTSRVGYPELPLKAVLLQVPPAGGIEVEVSKNDYETLADCLIYPVPRLGLSDQGEPTTEFVKDADLYGDSILYPGELAVIGRRSLFRGTTVARLKIYPFQWNPKTRELRYYKRTRIIIRFENPSFQSSVINHQSSITNVVFERLKKETIINYRKEPQEVLGKLSTTNHKSSLDQSAWRIEVNQDGMYQVVFEGNSCDVSGDGKVTDQDALCALQVYLEICPTSCGIPCEEIVCDVNQDGECTPADALEIFKEYLEIYPNACLPAFTYSYNRRDKLSYIHQETLQLFNQGNEVAIKVVYKEDDRLCPGDHIEFYGQGIDDTFTDTNVYWLSRGEGVGSRITTVNGEVTGQGEKIESFYQRLHIEENHTIWEATPGAPEEDYWFWEKITAPSSSEYTINLPSPVADQGEAVIRVCFQGRSTDAPYPDHHNLIYLNGTMIGDTFWDGDTEYLQEMIVPKDILLTGANTLTIETPGDTGSAVDIIYLNWIEVNYWRDLKAVEDELTFTVSGEGRFEMGIKELSSPEISIYDITDHNSVKEVIGFSIQPEGLLYKATFEDELDGAKTYHVLTASHIREPASMELWNPANLKSPTNRADWMVISAKEFLPSVEPLCQLRQSQGLRVKTVSVEDIYNEFNYGMLNPQAIKEFLRYAYENWERPAPTYLLLVGDANTDYRDYLDTGKESRVPVHLSITSLGVTPDDNWYVCVQGEDVLPDMFIGRIPGSSPAMVAQVVDKMVGFEESVDYERKGVLLVADDEQQFEDLNEELVSYLPPELSTDKVYLSNYESPDDATRDIISHIDEGMIITNYVGHGAVTNWAGEMMFESSDIGSLSNEGLLTFAITMTCLNGYFAQPYYYCLAEEFVAARDKGAIASFSPSGLGYLWEHEILDKEVFSAIFEQGNDNLGSLTTQSKIAAYGKGISEEVVKTFTLIGDPGARLKDWR